MQDAFGEKGVRTMNDRVSPRQSGTEDDGLTLTAEDKAKLEKLRKARLDAEYRNQKQAEKIERAKDRKAAIRGISKMPRKMILAFIAVLVLLAVLIPGVFVPMLKPGSATRYVSKSSLERAVNINELSTLNYTYNGIAEKISSFAIGKIHTPVGDLTSPEWVDYRVKYSANIRVEFSMSGISFKVDKHSKVITVLLPEMTLGTPQIDEESFDFLPENKTAGLAEVIKLCRDDASREIVQDAQLEERAYENLESTVRALTYPLIGDEYSLEFERPSTNE